MKTRKGIYYFHTYKDAHDFADLRGLPTTRLITYDCGWAIQLRKGGPYWGPAFEIRRLAEAIRDCQGFKIDGNAEWLGPRLHGILEAAETLTA